MDERDPELDAFLAPLQAEVPEAQAVRRWQQALESAASGARSAARWLGPRAIAAALLLMFGAGFGAGALVFRRPAPARASFAASNATAGASATEEHLTAKPD